MKHLLDSGPVVLFIDGHFSHAGIDLIKRARSLGIHLFRLPPNTTHLLQPLDVGVFGPMKNRWRVILRRYQIKTRAKNVNKQHFPDLIKQLWESSFTAEHLKGGFKAAGLIPFNPLVERVSQLAPSLPFVECEVRVTATFYHPACETPLRTELRGYFREALKPDSSHQTTQKCRRVRLQCEGELLTSDEVFERLEQADKERAAKKSGRRKKKDQPVSKMCYFC